MTIRLLAIWAMLVAASCGRAQLESTQATAAPPALRDLSYSGRWEFVRNRSDGRFAGRSASFHAGDALTVLFDGEGLRIYGVTGPNGGVGTVVVPGLPAEKISFYSARRATHVLLYSSPRMPAGIRRTDPRWQRRFIGPASRSRGVTTSVICSKC
jgi:hypothetical protein